MKKKGGNGKAGEASSLTLLESIRDELVSIRGEVGSLRSDVKTLRTELGSLRSDMNAGFAELRAEVAKTNSRLDPILVGPVGETLRRHDREILELREEMARYRGR
jgi:hypothetical protein